MKLTVLGSCGTYPVPGNACSGYLVEHDGFRVWVDAGSGTLANLQRHVSIDDVDAVVLSHMHADHFTDLYLFLYAVEFGPSGPRRIPVIGPSNGRDMFMRLLGEGSQDRFPKVFDWTCLDPGEESDVGPFRIRTFPARHSIENLSMRLEAGDTVLAYSGDTAPNPSLVPSASGADMFLCEASWQDGEDKIPEKIHCTAREAGIAAREAGVGRLVLTHIWPHYDRSKSVEQANDEFDGVIEVAHCGDEWTVGS